MRTTLDLDADLVRQALQETGAKSKTELIEMGLRALLERAARKRPRTLFGEGSRAPAGKAAAGMKPVLMDASVGASTSAAPPWRGVDFGYLRAGKR